MNVNVIQAMGRPRNDAKPTVVWNIKLLLYDGIHDDLLRVWREQVQGTRNGAAVAIALMRSGIGDVAGDGDDTDDGDIFELLDDMTL